MRGAGPGTPPPFYVTSLRYVAAARSGGSTTGVCCVAMLIFVTGAAGFIGSHLCERLCARGDDVVGYDNFDPFYPRADKERNLAKLRGEAKFTFVEGDIRDADKLDRVFAEKHPEVV